MTSAPAGDAASATTKTAAAPDNGRAETDVFDVLDVLDVLLMWGAPSSEVSIAS
jgi:hypothetical protein